MKARSSTSSARLGPADGTVRVDDIRVSNVSRDIDALLGLLDAEATVIADGGGLVSATLHPIEGGQQILQRPVNGEPGVIAVQNDVTPTVHAFSRGDRLFRSGQCATRTSSGRRSAFD